MIMMERESKHVNRFIQMTIIAKQQPELKVTRIQVFFRYQVETINLAPWMSLSSFVVN